MIKCIILSILSFMLGIFTKEIIENIRQYKKLKIKNRNRVL